MAWVDQLRPATFRGVPFKVEAHDTTGGRRVVTHEFPLRDKPFTEDMGRKAKELTIDAYVVGDDYMQARDALMRACDEAGSAELVHPYLGTLKVACTGWTLRESRTEGRMARFALSFVESGEAEFPSDSTDFAAQAESTYGEGRLAAADSLLGAFSIDGMPGFAVDDAAAIATTAVGFLGQASSAVDEIQQHGIGALLSGFVSNLSGADGLLNSPYSLAMSMLDIYHTVAGIFESGGNSRGGVQFFSGLSSFDGGSDIKPIPLTTSTRRQQQANRDALIGLVRQAAVFEAARMAPAAQYDTEADAVGARDTITDAIDTLSEAPETSDALYAVLQKMRTNVVSGVPPAGERLPDLVTLTPPATIPALVLAYDTYEDAARADEIVKRNSIKYPGFVPGAEPLRVLSNA